MSWGGSPWVYPVWDSLGYVNADGLAGPRGARDQQVRGLREVHHGDLAGDVASEQDRDGRMGFGPGGRFEQRTEVNRAGDFVRHLDADGVLAGDWRTNADALRLHSHGDVVLDAGDLFDADARGKGNLELRDARSDRDGRDVAVDAEALEGLFEAGTGLADVFLVLDVDV